MNRISVSTLLLIITFVPIILCNSLQRNSGVLKYDSLEKQLFKADDDFVSSQCMPRLTQINETCMNKTKQDWLKDLSVDLDGGMSNLDQETAKIACCAIYQYMDCLSKGVDNEPQCTQQDKQITKLGVDVAIEMFQKASSPCENHKKNSGECGKYGDGNGSVILNPTFSSILVMFLLLITLL